MTAFCKLQIVTQLLRTSCTMRIGNIKKRLTALFACANAVNVY